MKKVSRPAEVIPASAGRWFGKLAKLGQMAVIQLPRKSPAWTQRIAVHIAATKARRQMAGYEPYIPKIDLTMTGKGTLYVAPILPVSVMTTEQMRKPKKTMGIVSRAVNPRDITEDTVDASGGASISDVQYAQ